MSTPKIFVLYHADCADGFGAALVCWMVMGAAANYVPVRYGQPVPEIPHGARVYIVDFSYPADELMLMAQRSELVQVIDHHKTAQAALGGLDGMCDGRLRVMFDMEHSGAVLTWRHFFPGKTVPELLLYIEDRDLWVWRLPGSRAVSAALMVKPYEFDIWKAYLELGVNTLKQHGLVVIELIEQTAKKAAAKATPQWVWGHLIPAVNCTAFISETCHAMLETNPGAPFVACWFEDQYGDLVWSLRSRKSEDADSWWRRKEGEEQPMLDFDVSAVAKSLGGGGHRNAAGFTVKAGR